MSIHPTVTSLLEEIAEFRAKTGISATAFGLGAARDGALIKRLERGHSPTLSTIEKIRSFMRDRQGVAA